MVGTSETRALAPALHTDVIFLVEPRGGMVQPSHRTAATPRHVQQVRRTHRSNRVWTGHWNDNPKPFIWKKAADEIIEKVQRGRAALTEAKSATHH